ncbi:MAG: MotA/TolQ/ExbB proton channel family protein [Desulfobacterales bacterium]
MLRKLLLPVGLLFFIILSESVIDGTSIIMNLKSVVLVTVGTLLSALIAFPLKTFRDLCKSLALTFRQQETDSELLVKELEMLALIWRRSGIVALEKARKGVENVFLQKGIELVVDGYDRYDIRNIMEKDYELYFSRRESQVNILNTLAKLAPVFGFVGTILGLINVLNSMEDPAMIGKGMALALLTTLYGILLANFLFFPLSKKLSEYTKAEATVLNIILEGILDIADQKTSKSISHRLNSYLDVNQLSRMHKPIKEKPQVRPTPQIQVQ